MFSVSGIGMYLSDNDINVFLFDTVRRYRNTNAFMHNLQEVKMLARLNHPNIVAYKAAWLEPLDKPLRRAVIINTRYFYFNNVNYY